MSQLEMAFMTYLKEFAEGKGDVKLPKDDFNVNDVTVTNMINVEDQCIYTIVHFLFGYDDGEEMFTTNLGYRIAYRSDNIVQKDLVYVAGNNYLFKDFKLSVEQRIDPDLLYVFNPKNRKDLVSLFGWTMDLRDEKLFRKCCSEDIHIFRAGIDGYHYELNGINDCCSFMKKDREYFRNNTYSLVVEKEKDNEVLAYHLYPANKGNKHLGSNTRYVQFFNEDITFAFNDDQISEIRFKRKERPIVKRDQIIIL